jgi:hypothetical protein
MYIRKRGIATKNINAKNTRYTTTINKIMTWVAKQKGEIGGKVCLVLGLLKDLKEDD